MEEKKIVTRHMEIRLTRIKIENKTGENASMKEVKDEKNKIDQKSKNRKDYLLKRAKIFSHFINDSSKQSKQHKLTQNQ